MSLCAHGCATRTNRNAEQSQLRYELAADYYGKQRIEPALDELGKAVELDPENAEAYNLLGIITLQQGADYMRQLESADCLKGADAEGVRKDAFRKFREADTHFRKAVALRPSYPMAWNNLAVSGLQLQNYDDAIVASKNALKDIAYAQPEVARANLGWAHYHKRDLQSAWKELHEAVARSPRFCVARYRLAKVYVERKQYDMALEELEAVIEQKKDCPIQEVYLLAGLVRERRKEREDAVRMFTECMTLAPRSCVATECKQYAEMIQ